MKPIILIVFALFGVYTGELPSRNKQYRSDYEYNRKTDAFYKLHIESSFQRLTKDRCAVEGALLMIPATFEDITQVHGMMKQFPDIGDYVWVGDDGQKHDSAEEAPIIDLTPSNSEENTFASTDCEVVTRQGEVETMPCYRKLPFICKVEGKDAPFDARCDVYGTGYTFLASAHSCYRVPPLPMTWDQAYSECRQQGAHLAVLNSEAEHLAVQQFLNTVPKVPGATTTYFFLAGIRANRATNGTERVFRTVFNETLEEAGYTEWSDNEPNNYHDSEYCGTIFTNDGKYNDVDCSHPYGFICEKEVSSQ